MISFSSSSETAVNDKDRSKPTRKRMLPHEIVFLRARKNSENLQRFLSRNNEEKTLDDYERRDTVQRGKLIGLYTEGLEIDTLCVHFRFVLLRISC